MEERSPFPVRAVQVDGGSAQSLATVGGFLAQFEAAWEESGARLRADSRYLIQPRTLQTG